MSVSFYKVESCTDCICCISSYKMNLTGIDKIDGRIYNFIYSCNHPEIVEENIYKAACVLWIGNDSKIPDHIEPPYWCSFIEDLPEYKVKITYTHGTGGEEDTADMIKRFCGIEKTITVGIDRIDEATQTLWADGRTITKIEGV